MPNRPHRPRRPEPRTRNPAGAVASMLGAAVMGGVIGLAAVVVAWPDGPLALWLSDAVDRLRGEPALDPDAPPPVEGHRVTIARRLFEPAQPSRIVYLNREGAELRAGPDDAAYNVSSVVANSPTQVATIPPFASSAARWNSIAKCIRSKFKAFNVEIVEQRPVEGDYIMAMMGGRPNDLGFHKQDGHSHSHATGLAPFNGESIPRAVVYVFTRALKENTVSSCETAAMEIAHAYGLDHARNCRDLMTYMPRCGTRTFLDKALRCGEHKDRDCPNAVPTQNSYQRLLAILGPAPAADATASKNSP